MPFVSLMKYAIVADYVCLFIAFPVQGYSCKLHHNYREFYTTKFVYTIRVLKHQ